MRRPRLPRLSPFAALLLCLTPAMAQQPPAKFAPIPVSAIFRPLQANGTADDALASGRVVTGQYGPAMHASKRWRIAFLFPHTKDPYWSGVAYGVISEARRLGVAADILPSAGYDDLQGQLRKMNEAIAAKYDAIVVSPISMTANNASIAKARAAGITVLELANDSRSDDLHLKVTTSLRGMGLEATRWVIRDAQQRGLKSINIALLPGPMGAGWVKGEVDGTRIAAQEAPIEVNILDIRYGDSERGLQAQLAGRILARHGRRLDYLLDCTGCAPAALGPLKSAGLAEQVRVVAYDLTSEIMHLIRSKEIAAAADTKGVSQARVAINAAVNLLEGRAKEQPHTVLVKLGMLDQQNLASYPFDTSIAPDGHKLQLSYDPAKE
ncbi:MULTISPECIES: TMAO reductase system periplasmic protein TorT [unclassified Duganella]|uniref:TMAO reductase system periplasmic protein TorT n=1 Tax=unclassified Duganella TaxID=2636909 RepID=UPI00087E478F|nr:MULTISPECIES: TMAO reductase system periplasmic protein TorT [unclassified Duganella]SDG17414.1 protein TorT [Duganella sp. OV458]SDJ30535.1 monosaccharide ABC transporter substrate-binding protein, CUT2 family [Duganella sp. OV510]